MPKGVIMKEIWKNVFYFKKISSIGGVESFFYYLSKLYKNMVVYYKEGDPEQIKRLAHNIEVHKFNGEKIVCDRFFCNYGFDIGDYIEAKEYYHIIHCDYKKVTFKPIVYHGFKYIGVSKLVCDSFKELTGIEAELIYNPVYIKKKKGIKKYDDGKIHILVASRLTKEKGGERIVKLAQMSNDFVIDLYSNRHLFPQLPNIIEHDTKLDLREEMQKANYVAQLSEHEAFGLSVAESLILGTPVIVTDIPAFREIGCKHGKNSVICDLDMKNVDIEMIKNGLPPFKYKAPKSNWDKYLDNESDYNPKDLVKVRTKKKLWDTETDIHHKANAIIELTKERASYMEALGYVEVL